MEFLRPLRKIAERTGLVKSEEKKLSEEINKLKGQLIQPRGKAWLIELPKYPDRVKDLQAKSTEYKQRISYLEETKDSLHETEPAYGTTITALARINLRSQILDLLVKKGAITVEDFGFNRRDWFGGYDSWKPRYETTLNYGIRDEHRVRPFKAAWGEIQLYALNGTERVDRLNELKDRMAKIKR